MSFFVVIRAKGGQTKDDGASFLDNENGVFGSSPAEKNTDFSATEEGTAEQENGGPRGGLRSLVSVLLVSEDVGADGVSCHARLRSDGAKKAKRILAFLGLGGTSESSLPWELEGKRIERN